MYCASQDIIEMIGEDVVAQLTNDVDATVVNETLLDNIVLSQSNLIDDYLRGRYTLPLSNSHSILKSICIDFVNYELHKRRNLLTDSITEIYKTALKLIEQLQKGLIKLNESGTDRPAHFVYLTKTPIYVNDL